jgi:queuine tRNA-ribosyltransferase
MRKPKYFNSKTAGKIPLPVFFPDATKAVVRTLDSQDIEDTKTKGILVNTYHLFKNPGKKVIEEYKGVRNFMNWHGAVISDSGGFQVGSLVKKNPQLGKVTDKGVYFKFPGQAATLLTPELSIDFQMSLDTDMVVALDDFDAPNATEGEAKESVRRTILWAERSKKEFERIMWVRTKNKVHSAKESKDPISHNSQFTTHHPYLLGVIQGGRNRKLRKYCVDELIKIGFDGLGYGGEEKIKGNVNYDLAEYLSSQVPDNYFRYALGVGKPEDVVNMSRLGWNIFDCVLPTRDARHKRLYVYNTDKIENIDLYETNFYSFYTPDKSKYKEDKKPVSTACDCLLCTNYSRGYLYHLFKEKEMTAMRLSTIHNLRFYAILMEKIGESSK